MKSSFINNIRQQEKIMESLNPLSAKPTKWPKTLKLFVGKLPTNCLNVFDHFVGLALKGLSKACSKKWDINYPIQSSYRVPVEKSSYKDGTKITSSCFSYKQLFRPPLFNNFSVSPFRILNKNNAHFCLLL